MMHAEAPEYAAPGDLLCGASAVRTAGRLGPWTFPRATSSATRKTLAGTREAPVLKGTRAVSASPRSTAPAKCWTSQPLEKNSKQLTPRLERAVKVAPSTGTPFQAGKSHLTRHFNSAASCEDTLFTNQPQRTSDLVRGRQQTFLLCLLPSP